MTMHTTSTIPAASKPVPDCCQDTDAALIRQLRNGEETAFEQLVRAYGGRMQAVAMRIVQNEQDTQDVLQEAFIQAFRGLGTFRGDSQLGTWLHRITVNAALMRLRSRKRIPEQSIDEMLPAFGDDGHRLNVRSAWDAAADELLQREETCAMVRRSIDRLPEPYRVVLMLRDIEQLSTEEAAEAMSIKPGAVKTRLHRARMALRELLETELV